MDPTDSRLRRILAAVYDLYGKELSPTAMKIWYEAMKGFDLDVVRAALSAHTINPDNGQFLPKPADIVKLIHGGSDDVALKAWAQVDRALRMVGTYNTVVFDDPLIHHCIVALGGWIKLGALTEEDWKYQRQPFVTLYRGARMRSIDYPAKLLGIAEHANRGRWKTMPVLVGDREKCLHVLHSGSASAQLEARLLSDAISGRLPPPAQEEAAA